jgi:hypothetical protein
MQRYRQSRGRDIRLSGCSSSVIRRTIFPARVRTDAAPWGVGTGQFRAEQLLAAGADHAVADLSNTDSIAGWILG